MPWSPDWQVVRDPRLDLCRDRVAVLERAGAAYGHALFLSETMATCTGGHLWWRRWRFHEALRVYSELADGSSTNDFLDEGAEEFVQQLSEGHVYWDFSGVVDLRWLEQEEALAVAPGIFGVTWCLDNDGRVMWSWPDQ